MEKNKQINFVSGGKLGDFIQILYAVKGICEQNNAKANIYLCDIGWDFGIKNTYGELYPILIRQSYINNISILREDDYTLDPIQTPQQNTPITIHDQQILKDGFVDMGDYLRSSHLYRSCWTTLFSETFNFPKPVNPKWITVDKKNDAFADKVVIHRKASAGINTEFPHKEIIDKHTGRIVFVSSNENDYQVFPYKDEVPFVKMHTLDDWFTTINSSKLFISNLTGPAAISHALDVHRIIELPYTPDIYHCIGEEKYSSNIKWFLNNENNNLGDYLNEEICN